MPRIMQNKFSKSVDKASAMGRKSDNGGLHITAAQAGAHHCLAKVLVQLSTSKDRPLPYILNSTPHYSLLGCGDCKVKQEDVDQQTVKPFLLPNNPPKPTPLLQTLFSICRHYTGNDFQNYDVINLDGFLPTNKLHFPSGSLGVTARKSVE